MKITQEELDRYRDAIRKRQRDARAYVLARLQQEAHGDDMTVAEARVATIEIMRDSLGVFGDQAQALSAELFDEICEAEDIDAKPGQMFDSLIDAAKLAEKVHYYAGKLADGDWDGYAGSNADLAAYYVHRSALANMERNCYENHVRYARVGTGRETCGWCFMLSSRGFDYRSEKTARAASHAHCDCIIVPGKKGITKIEGYEPEEMARRWGECREAIGGDEAIRDGFDALTKGELAKIKGRNRSEKWTRYRNAMVNAECERNDSLWLYRGVKLKGRNKILGPMDEESARAYVRTKTQSKEVNQKQARHRGENIGTRSRVDISDAEIEELVEKYAGKGKVFVNEQPNGTPQIKEVITVSGDIIGVWRMAVDGEVKDQEATDTFTVHYSDDGIHIVPSKPSWVKR